MPSTTPPDDEGSLLTRTIAQLRSASSARPRAVDLPKVPGALKLYRVTAYITGVMLLLLTAVTIADWGLGYTIYAFIPGGATLAFVKGPLVGGNQPGLNLSQLILIAHGWLYVLYLFADFRLWSLMRLSFTKFVQIALGGVIPFMSFIVEHFISKQVNAYLSSHAAPEAVSPAEASH